MCVDRQLKWQQKDFFQNLQVNQKPALFTTKGEKRETLDWKSFNSPIELACLTYSVRVSAPGEPRAWKSSQTSVHLKAKGGVTCDSSTAIALWASFGENSHKVNSVVSCLKPIICAPMDNQSKRKLVLADDVVSLRQSWKISGSAQPHRSCCRLALQLPTADSSLRTCVLLGSRDCPPATHRGAPQLPRALLVGGVHTELLLPVTFRLCL